MKTLALALALALAACATTSSPATPIAHRVHDVAELALERPEVIAFQAPLELARSTPALATSAIRVPADTMTCTGTAARVQLGATIAAAAGHGIGYSAIQVWVNSATPVYFGDANVTTTGWPLCTASASCPQAFQSYETKDLYCKSSSGSVTVNLQVAQ